MHYNLNELKFGVVHSIYRLIEVFHPSRNCIDTYHIIDYRSGKIHHSIEKVASSLLMRAKLQHNIFRHGVIENSNY